MSRNAKETETVLKQSESDREYREVPETVFRQSEGDSEPKEFRVVRGSRRRRRKLQAEAPQQKFRLVLLIIVIVLIIVVLSGGTLGARFVRRIMASIPQSVLHSVYHTVARPEVIVLVLAALILIYLMVPSLESRVLSMLGIQRRHRRHQR
jgi:hypothetical protein